MAERVGFEPTVPLTVHKLSKRAENFAAWYQHLFNHITAIIELDCDNSESEILTQTLSQIVVVVA